MLPALLETLFNQHARLLELKTALPDAALLVERLTGHEALSDSFRFEVDCISTNAHIDLNNLLGEEIRFASSSPVAASVLGTVT